MSVLGCWAVSVEFSNQAVTHSCGLALGRMLKVLRCIRLFIRFFSSNHDLCRLFKVCVCGIFNLSDAEYILDHNGAFTKDLWPVPLLATVNGRTHEELEGWQIMPISFLEICEWAYISRKKEQANHTWLYQLLYNTPDTPMNTIYPVVLCVQGILGWFKVSPLGTWNG